MLTSFLLGFSIGVTSLVFKLKAKLDRYEQEEQEREHHRYKNYYTGEYTDQIVGKFDEETNQIIPFEDVIDELGPDLDELDDILVCEEDL